jgi:hypothetical protein
LDCLSYGTTNKSIDSEYTPLWWMMAY